MTSLDFEKSKQCESVWMGAQRDLKDSNEVIEGWVSNTHKLTSTFTYAGSSAEKYKLYDKLKVREKSLKRDNKIKES